MKNCCAPTVQVPVVASEPQGKVKAKEQKMSLDTDLSVQSGYMAYELTYYILSTDNIRLNGYANGSHSHETMSTGRPCLNDPKFLEAFENLKTMCTSLKERHGQEIAADVQTLDVCDEQLYGTFHKTLATIVEDIDDGSWGRIAALFLFTASLSKRLYREGQQEKINCLIGWLYIFINRKLHGWLIRQGGWVSIVHIRS